MIDLGPVYVGNLVEAMKAVDFGDPKALDGQLSTADIGETHKFSKHGEVIENNLRMGKAQKRIASILRPGQGCEFHTHELMNGIRGRIHIPVISNPHAWFCYENEEHNLKVGHAYLVFANARHRVYNAGDTDRIHYIFDF